jgi:tetratricopeptide (TPR) repeat protein
LIPFPTQICEITSLKTLKIFENIVEIPEDLKKLQNLEELEIHSKILQDYPAWIHDFPALKKFTFNRFRCLPIDLETCFHQARRFFYREDFDKAIAWLEKALTFNMRHEEVWNDMAYAYLGLGRSHEALDAVEQSLDIDPYNANFWDTRSDVYYYLGRHSSALKSAKRALELDPKSRKYTYKVEKLQEEISKKE